MEVHTVGAKMLRLRVADDVNLSETLDGGQAFRWRTQNDGSICGIVEGNLVRVVLDRHEMSIERIAASKSAKKLGEPFWRNYFALDIDYRAIEREYSKDPVLAKSVGFAHGLRVLRQDFFETLMTFIVTQNNNIPRIKKIVETMCGLFGEKIDATGVDGLSMNAFPTLGAFSALAEDDLAPLHAGYRVPYLIATAKSLASDDRFSQKAFEALADGDARKRLLEPHGVGPKVADCVMLFGLGRFGSFPVDVWIRRAMSELFPNGLPECAKATAGIAQQYLFSYARATGLGK